MNALDPHGGARQGSPARLAKGVPHRRLVAHLRFHTTLTLSCNHSNYSSVCVTPVRSGATISSHSSRYLWLAWHWADALIVVLSVMNGSRRKSARASGASPHLEVVPMEVGCTHGKTVWIGSAQHPQVSAAGHMSPGKACCLRQSVQA